MSTNQQNQQGGDSKKEAKKFESNMRRLIALFNGKEIWKKPKLGGTNLDEAMAELAKEEKEGLFTEFKTKCKELIQNKRDFDAMKKQKEQEMAKADTEKQKEFNKTANALFGIIDKMENIERSYYQTLSSTGPKVKEASEVETDKEGADEDVEETEEEN